MNYENLKILWRLNDMDEIKEMQLLVKELREKWEQTQEGLFSKSEFKEFEEKVNSRIDELELAIKRPPAGESKEDNFQKKAFFKFMREGKQALTPEETKALVSDETGQILIPEELESEIYRKLPKITIIRNLATVRTIRSDRIRRRSLNEVKVGWGKLETMTHSTHLFDYEQSLTPSAEWQYVEDLYGLTKVGEDELMDTDVALEAIISDSFARAIAETEDTAFIKGTGHNNGQPEGILDGTVVTRVPAGQPGAITADDILGLPYEVPAQYRKNGVFIMNSKTEKALRLLKASINVTADTTTIDGQGQYLWQPSLQAGRPATLDGYPVYNQDDMPVIPTAGTGTAADVVIFGDVRAGYRVIDRLGMTLQRLVELYSESGLIGFKVHFRVGGGVIRPEALRVLQVPAN